jgi:hypothetical protein
MTRADWFALVFVALAALLGLRRGLIGSAFSLAGVVAGAILGGRLAPHLIAGGDSPYTPLVALAGAVVGAFALELLGTLVSNAVRRSLYSPRLPALDAAGGLVLGAAAGLAVVWVAGAVALHLPGRTELRRDAQRSVVLRNLNAAVTPDRLIRAIQRVDPFPSIAGPPAPVDPPDPRLPARTDVRGAYASVVRVEGDACGLAVSGSGWVARGGLVVTAAHVVAGQRETSIEHEGGILRAAAVVFDPRNDVAVLRPAAAVGVRPLALGDATPGEPVAILGFPEGGAFDGLRRSNRLARWVRRAGAGHSRSTRLRGAAGLDRRLLRRARRLSR